MNRDESDRALGRWSAAAWAALHLDADGPRWRAPVTWIAIAALALVLAATTRHFGMGIVGAVLYAVVAAVYVYRQRGARPAAALQASAVVLVVAESVLAPAEIAQGAPVLVALLALASLVGDRCRIRPSALLYLVVAFAIMFVLPTVLMQGPGRIVKSAGIAVMWVAVAFAASAVRTVSGAHRLSITIVGLGLTSAALALVEALPGSDLVREFVVAATAEPYVFRGNTILGDWVTRAQATFAYPIPLAAFLAVCLILAFVALRRPWLRWTSIGCLAAGIMLTGSRSGVVAVAAGLVCVAVWTLADWRKERWSWRRGGAALGIVIGAVAAVLVFLARSLVTGDFSLTHRVSMIAGTLEAVSDRGIINMLLGGGYGSVEQAFADGTLGTPETPVLDNAYAATAMINGVVGLALLLAMIVVALLRGGRGAGAAVAVLAACFFFFDALQWHVIAFTFFVFVGLSARPGIDAHRGRHSDRSLTSSG